MSNGKQLEHMATRSVVKLSTLSRHTNTHGIYLSKKVFQNLKMTLFDSDIDE